MRALKGFVDNSRAVLRMEGVDVHDVLQNTITNDVDAVKLGHAVYAAMLTPQGKYLFDFFLIADGQAVLIDVARDRAAALAQRFEMYCLRRDASVTGAANLQVALVWAGSGHGKTQPPNMPKALAPFARLVKDPRRIAVGWRLYAGDAGTALDSLGAIMATRPDYDALRVTLVIPESGIELVPDETYILEAGFEVLNGVDFRKGCYVGQEVTARMYHKAELKKRLVQVRVEGAAPPGTPITADGRPAGTLFTQAGGRALAHLRLDRAKGPLQAGAARVIYED